MKNDNKTMRKLAAGAVSLLFPRVCPLCGQILKKSAKDADRPPFICNSCRKQLSFPDQPRCMCCSKSIEEEEEEFCEDCRKRKRSFDRGWGMLLHDDAARKIIYDLKFNNRRDNADFLGHAMAEYFAEQLKNWEVEALIPVPLHKKRKIQRGFNQAEWVAEKMAYWLKEKSVDLPVDTELLIRKVSTLPQRKLDRASRSKNMFNVFAATMEKKYRTVVLIDDIYTSGATLDEAAQTLKKSGVERVYFLTASIV